MIEFGKKIYPIKKKKQLEKTETSIRGSYWSIELKEKGYVFEYVSGGHGGGLKEFVVTKDDFEAVHSGRMTEYDLALKYNLN